MTEPIDSVRDQLKALEREEKLVAKLDEARQEAHGQTPDTKEYQRFIKAEQDLVDHRSEMNQRFAGGGLTVNAGVNEDPVSGQRYGDPDAAPDQQPAEPAAPPEQ